MEHSTIVGGSTAKRVMNCPGSVALVAKAPVAPSSVYADKGTLLHNLIAEVLDTGVRPESLIGRSYEDQTLDQEMVTEKLRPALAALDVLDPKNEMETAIETRVSFGATLPGAFGSCDVLGRIGSTAYVIDWKFGDGVTVDAEENEQLMFYAAAAMRTPEAAWVFDGVTDIVCAIIQPPVTRTWRTTPERIKIFERDLIRSVALAKTPDAPLKVGEHCRFCPAKPTCPLMTGAVDRALKVKLDGIDNNLLAAYATNAMLLKGWIESVEALVEQKLKAGASVPGWKLVAKRGTRKWADEKTAPAALQALGIKPTKEELVSPAQAEKLLKPLKLNLPDGLVVTISSGDTLAPDSDPRPAVLQIGQQLTAALSKLV